MLCAVGLLGTGCAHTLSGAQQDATTDVKKAGTVANIAANKTAQAANNIDQAVQNVPDNAEAATIVTPLVKTAIIRDPVLDNSANQITVFSENKVTRLRGHVSTDRMKQRATEDAQAGLGKKFADYQIDNELTIQ